MDYVRLVEQAKALADFSQARAFGALPDQGLDDGPPVDQAGIVKEMAKQQAAIRQGALVKAFRIPENRGLAGGAPKTGFCLGSGLGLLAGSGFALVRFCLPGPLGWGWGWPGGWVRGCAWRTGGGRQ